jgi:hypothetical protein
VRKTPYVIYSRDVPLEVAARRLGKSRVELEAPQLNALHGGRVAQLMWIKTAAERFGIDNILELASQGFGLPPWGGWDGVPPEYLNV